MTLRRLLAVSHRGQVGGAPIVLEDLVRWITEHTEVEVTTVMLTRGDMYGRFREVSTVFELDELTAAADASGGGPLDGLGPFDLVLLNSLESLALLPALPDGVPVVSPIHELQVSCREWLRPVDGDPLRTGPDAWIAASAPVRSMLVEEYGCPSERVHLHPSFIDVARLEGRRADARALESLRRSVGIPREAPVVMGSGTFEWRKGPELFVQLAGAVQRAAPDPVHFVWVGGNLDSVEYGRVRSDIQRAGIEHLHITGDVDEPIPYQQLADVFVLTSHEDPHPLVCLEQGALGHPVVSFRNGGIVDVLTAAGPDAAQGVVDHLDVASMAERTLELLYDERRRRRAGEQLRDRVLAAHDVPVAAPALFEDLRRSAGLTVRAPGGSGGRKGT